MKQSGFVSFLITHWYGIR